MCSAIVLPGLELPRLRVLHPGDVACVGRGDTLQTLLGSCVAVILTDRRRCVGAMCHIVHAGRTPTLAQGSNTAFAGAALQAMTHQLLARGIQARWCEAYVYGGGNMFPQLVRHGHVGAGNVQHVLELLAALEIPVLHQDVEGNVYRRLSWTVGPTDPRVVPVAV